MSPLELDDVDRGILHLLQVDARNNSPADIAEQVGVAPNTVRNRLKRLEDHDVIEGYQPQINYERAGYQLRVTFICTVPVSERNGIADEVMEIEGVIQVVENLSGRQNLTVDGVGENSEDITAIATSLESLECVIEDEWFIENARTRPFDHFGVEEATEG